MNKVLIDTNVLLRYLLDDNEDMSLVSEHIIDGGAWTTPEVLAELTYVLDCIYEVPRAKIYEALCIVSNLLYFENRAIIDAAIEEYGNSKLDFVDCMMVAYHKSGATRIFSFDKGINKRTSNFVDK